MHTFSAHAAPTMSAPEVAAVVLAGFGSTLIVAVGLIALLRRQSRSHALVVLALAALLARSGVAVLTIGGVVPFDFHHAIEHALDFVMVALVIAAVYYARSIERAAPTGERR
ncbi:DUF7471 family protein [Haloprofundus halobius]|uniref:DUF7471 family protein n=1 Tax=Haloprofundus halobius TaxID=2876194 RepID=UPI001CCCC27F|nr:hypothetical protein [Haloprofundus halobius]